MARGRAAALPPGSAASAGATLLGVHGVSVVYRPGGREIAALRDVSLSVSAGEMVGLIGPNGSGKTTLVRAVTGLVRLEAGRVLLAGQDASRLSQRERALRAAVVPQMPVLPEAFTALEMVMMGRTPHLRLLQSEGDGDMAAARRAMAATSTWEFAGRPVGELSGGERQRVVLARALAQETPVLMLDEPTAHLDIGHQAATLDLVRALCHRDGKAVLAVVHDLTLAAQYCDRLVMLCRGEVAARGDAAAVLHPGLLADVYGRPVDVFPHPQTGRPVVALRPEGA